MKTCPLCNKVIEYKQSVVAVLGAVVDVDPDAPEDKTRYQLQVTRQAILSHLVCP